MKKVFKTIFEYDNEAWVEYIPAKDEKEVVNNWGGNGEIVKIEDYTNKIDIYLDGVNQALKNAGFSQMSIDIISRTLQNELDCIK